ncbi:MAG: SPFH domain-containing protein [Deinococcus sp.]
MSIVLITVVVLVLLVLSRGVRSVSQGFEVPLERFGRYEKTLKPGLNFIVPFMERPARRVDMRETVLPVDQTEAITRDNAIVRIDGVLFYQVLDARQATYEVANLPLAIQNLAQTNLRNNVGGMPLDNLLSERDTINSRLLQALDEATHPWGVKITRVEIKDITPPEDIQQSMARQLKAEREKRANILEAEGFRQAAILKAEGQQQATVLAAEGEKQAAYLQADARERLAGAEARATQLVSDAIRAGDPRALNYFIAQRYTDSLRDIASAPNSKVVFLPLEASGLVGAVGGVAELLGKGVK